MPDENTLLTVIQTCQRLGISRTTLFVEERRGNPYFPKKIYVTSKRVAYLLSDITAYLAHQQSADAWRYDWRHRRDGKAA